MLFKAERFDQQDPGADLLWPSQCLFRVVAFFKVQINARFRFV